MAAITRARMLWHTVVGPLLIHLFVSVFFAGLAMNTGAGSLLSPDAPEWTTWLKTSTTVLLSIGYEIELWRHRRSPFVDYWRALRFRAPSYGFFAPIRAVLPWFDRRVAIWTC